MLAQFDADRRLLFVTRLAAVVSVSSLLAMLVWAWGQLSWKASGTPGGAFRVALVWFLPRFRVPAEVLGVALLLALIWLGIRSRKTAAARCESMSGGVARTWQIEQVSEYHADGLTLQRLSCQTTFQYLDQRFEQVIGVRADGSELTGPQLFRRIAGPPTERALAARELLLSDSCTDVFTRLAQFDAYRPYYSAHAAQFRPPAEENSKLVFYGLEAEHPYGDGTSVGVQQTLTHYEIDLRSLMTSTRKVEWDKP